MKEEMTAREYAYQRARCCCIRPHCEGCPLEKPSEDYECSCSKYELEHPDEAVRLISEWAAEHPEETLEPVGDGIYFDPKHRIVPDEAVRVTTIEMTHVIPPDYLDILGNREFDKDAIKRFEDGIREYLWPFYKPDDLHINVQQFITKCHEEET